MSYLLSLLSLASLAVESSYTLNEKGLIVVAIGLAGVFIILLLFFATIILIQKIVGLFDKTGKKPDEVKE
ncbi:MAG: hypothetical protein PHP22_10025 [Oscillospiraceae bacterium]|jgi:Na+-transporting methylmalonyl-CoA/oxaloacetate decarboxylase gamma subunit|nr:hypothetical protein [Oscillospiraceae bacterium]